MSLKIQINYKGRAFLDKVFRLSNQVYNRLVSHCQKQIRKLRLDPDYRRAMNDYIQAKQRKDKPAVKHAEAALSECIARYGLTEYSLHTYVKVQQHKYAKYIDAFTAQKIATTAYRAVASVLYRKGKQVHFRKWTDALSIEGKSNKQGIRYKNGRLYFAGRVFCLQAPDRKDNQRWYYERAMENRICFVRIKRRSFGSGWQYYAELIFDGVSPKRIRSRTGSVGIDIGTSTVAAVGARRALLKTLGHGLKDYDRQIEDLSRRMDQSRRDSNPQNYNTDGTIKKGRKHWAYTKSYLQKQFRLKTLYRRRKEALSQWQDILIKELLAMGNTFFVETMNFKALQAKAKESHDTDKTIETVKADGTTRTVQKQSSKKRFGKSLKNHAPAAMLTKLESRAASAGGAMYKIDTAAFKASQYDHEADAYIKHELSDRTKKVAGQLVQRDLYSAFLLKHSMPDLKSPDRTACKTDFKNFLRSQESCLKDLYYRSDDHNANFGLNEFARLWKAEAA